MALVVALVVALCAVPVATAAKNPRVTVIGDSVQASFSYVPAATARLGRGLDLRLDALVCRRLVARSCAYDGVTPLSALEVIAATSAPRLGRVVVINVGYNDDASSYDVKAVIRALRAKGVRRVVWVTLHDPGSRYLGHNAAIRRARTRGSGVTIADWATVSSGRPWFATDGLHLNRAGAMALAGLIRSKVLAAL